MEVTPMVLLCHFSQVATFNPAATADKLRALRASTAHAFPTGPIEEMLAEIERGYGSSS